MFRSPNNNNKVINNINFYRDDFRRREDPLSASSTDINFIELTDEWVVKVKLIGACSSCSISLSTLKNGVEVVVKRAVPEVKEVIEISAL